MTENSNTNKLAGREVIFEYRQIGNIMRVVAMDVESKTEISIQCPISAGEPVWQKNALLRLEYVLKKEGKIK